MTLKRVLGSMLWFILLTPFASIAIAQSTTGVVAGTVVDETTQLPLPGAAVKLDGSPLTSDTDRTGHFNCSASRWANKRSKCLILDMRSRRSKLT